MPKTIHPNSLKNLTYRFPKGHTFNTGKIFTQEHRKRLSLARIGKKLSEEHRKKLKENNAKYWLGKKRPEVKKWLVPLPAGIYKHTEEAKKKISESHRKERHYRWNPNREEVMYDRRNDPEYKQWRKRVWSRDEFKCKIGSLSCGDRIEAHHILRWSEYPELRYELNNGITLCQAHHPRKRAEENRLIPYFMGLVPVSNS